MYFHVGDSYTRSGPSNRIRPKHLDDKRTYLTQVRFMLRDEGAKTQRSSLYSNQDK